MSEIRVQLAYHFKIDPAKLSAGTIVDRVPLPEQLTRTVSVGDDLITEKVTLGDLSPLDRSALREMIHKQIKEATRTARPVGSTTDKSEPSDLSEDPDDEISAF
jgi:hypothetical protein